MMTSSTILPATGRSSHAAAAAAAAGSGDSGGSLSPQPHALLTGGGQLSLSMEKLLEHASATGSLKLCARNLKKFPRHGDKFPLQDTVEAGTTNDINTA